MLDILLALRVPQPIYGLRRNRGYVITDSRYTEQASVECQGYTVIQYSTSPWATIRELVEESRISLNTVAYEGSHLYVDTFSKLQSHLSFVENFTSVELEPLRAIKNDTELSYMRHAAHIADNAFSDILYDIKVGRTEQDLRRNLEIAMLRHGSEGPAFATIVASGKRSSLPHGVATDKIIEMGDFITFDFGAIYKGYHSDITRTVIVGEPTEEQDYLYHTLLEAQELGVASVKPGVTGAELDAIVRNKLAENGLDKYFTHSLGHGVGLAIHELPVASPKSTDVLQKNMVVTIEPGIYIPNHLGLRIEDSVIVTDTGAEIITCTPKTLYKVGI